jgi:hypothetical protein
MSKNLYGVTNKMVVTLGGRRTKAKAMKAVEIEEEIRSQQKSEGIRRAGEFPCSAHSQ